MENRKKTILISAIIIVLFLIIGAIVFYFLVKKENGPETPGTFPESGGSTFPGSGGTGGTGGGDQGAGGTGAPATPPVGGTGHPVGSTGFKPILRLVSALPVSGAITYNKTGKAYTRYIERTKGNTYETEAESIRPQRLTNNTVPQVYYAFFGKNGEVAVLQYLKGDDQVQTFSANVLPKSEGQGELRGQFLTPNITSLSLSPSGSRVLYTIDSAGGGVAETSALDGSKKTEIYSSPLSEWITSWPKEDTALLTSKAGYGTEGQAISVDTTKGSQNVLLSGIMGLTTIMSGDGSKLLYSRSTDGGLSTGLYNLLTKSNSRFSLVTLPEKCVWGIVSKKILYCAVPESVSQANYPDDWYQGLVSFRDEIWKIDTETSNTEYIASLGTLSKTDFDAINLSLDDKERFITIINKNNLSLWTLQIAP